MAKLRIGTKIFITYILILIVTLSMITISFNVLSKRYLINETRENLRKEGLLIAETLKDYSFEDEIKDKLFARRELTTAGRFVVSKIIVFDKTGKVIYSNLDTDNHEFLVEIAQSNEDDLEGFVIERVIILDTQGELKGHVFMLSKIEDITSLSNLMKSMRFLSFSIAGIIALILSYFFGRSLTKPIRNLSNCMRHFSLKNNTPVNIKTNDEIEDLANGFNSMIDRLKNYDNQQKIFLQNTSHELKTPLMSIQGYAEAIKDGVVEGKEVDESLDIIIEESKRLKKIVDEIIYLTKLENVESNFTYTEVKIGEIINNSIKSVNSLANDKDIEIDVKGNLDYIGRFDDGKLKQAFINILGNSIRYANKLITITVSKLGNNLEIIIKDDGPGFEEGEEKKIFSRFYKGANGGSGIGLAITKAIIEGHGGSIKAFNNDGAEFRIIMQNSL